MSLQERRLSIECRQMSETLAKLIDRLEAAPEPQMVGAGTIRRELRRQHRRLNTLARAVSRPAALGILGTSQAARSALTRRLTREPTLAEEPVALVLDASLPHIDLASLLASADGDDPGVAVRLTARPPSAPPQHPVPLQLLGLADVVRILARIYFSTCSLRGDALPDAQSIRSLALSCGRQMSLFPVRGLEVQHVDAIRDEIETLFSSEPIVGALAASGYWDQCQALITHLPDQARAELLAPLWGGSRVLSAMFLELAEALESLSYTTEIYAAAEAIVELNLTTRVYSGHAKSVLFPAPARELLTDPEPISVRSRLGHSAFLRRAELACLATEVRLSLARPSGPVMENLQVVDLPTVPRRVLNAGPAAGLTWALAGALFQREKRAYLLEQYVVEQELSGLVVCLDGSGEGADSLAAPISDWVERTHGREPAEREESDTALFIAATDKDPSLPVLRSETQGRAWLGHVCETVVEGLGRQSTWPTEWTPGRPFDNLFLLRRSSQASSTALALMRTPATDESRLAALVPAHDSVMARFLADDDVRRHVREPAVAWAESMQGEDGGLSYLAHSISDVCDGQLKQRQVEFELRSLRRELRDLLLRAFPGQDGSRGRDWRLRDARVAVTRLRRMARQRRFGVLMRVLSMPESELIELFVRLEGGQPLASEPRPPEEARGLQSFAATAIDAWQERMRLLASSRAAEHVLVLPRRTLAHLVEEMCAAVRRLDLTGVMAARLAWTVPAKGPLRDRAGRAAMHAATLIANFVATLGFEDLWSDGQPRRRGRHRAPIFSSLSAGTPGWEWSADVEEDWCLAFGRLVRDNIAAGGARGELVRDEQLGELLIGLGVMTGSEFET